MSQLIPCDGCGRHVLSSEPACPFCGGDFNRDRATPARPARRLGRAATFAFGAAVAAAGVSGCGDSHSPDSDAAVESDAGVDSGGVAPPYGTPPEDAGLPAPAYGAPPEDAGFAPLYGGAPED